MVPFLLRTGCSICFALDFSGDSTCATGKLLEAWTAIQNDPTFILCILGANIVLAEVLCRYTLFRHFGTTMTVMMTAAITANLGIIPHEDTPLYNGVFQYVAPMCIFCLLLCVNLKDLRKAGGPMIAIFLLGSVGTVLGVVVGMWLVDGREVFGEFYRGIGGTYVATYTGGAANFNALAQGYSIDQKSPALFATMNAVDAFYTLVWMVFTFSIPRLSLYLRGRKDPSAKILLEERELISGVEDDTETVHPLDLACLTTVTAGAVWFARLAADGSARALTSLLSNWELTIDSRGMFYILLTTIALVIAQIPRAKRFLRGAQMLGMFAMYLFLAVLGAYCNIGVIAKQGDTAIYLLQFVAVVIGCHGLVSFAGGALLRLDFDMIAVASQANIGGATTALGLARTLGRKDLVLPGILVGALGYAVGTYLGFFTAEILLSSES